MIFRIKINFNICQFPHFKAFNCKYFQDLFRQNLSLVEKIQHKIMAKPYLAFRKYELVTR